MGKLVRIAVEDITCQSFGEILEQSFQYTASDIGAWSVGFYYLFVLAYGYEDKLNYEAQENANKE